MDTDYKAVDIEDMVIEVENLSEAQTVSLRRFLNKYKVLFDDSLGDYDIPPIKLDVKPGI